MKFKKIVIKAACVLTVLAICAATIWDFSTQMQRVLTRETYKTLSGVSADYNKAFLDRISYHMTAMKMLAGSLEEMRDEPTPEVLRVLENAAQDSGFSQVVLCSPQGVLCSRDGASGLCRKDLQGLQSQTQDPFVTRINGEQSLVFSVPIGQEGQEGGVLFGVYPLATAGDQLLDFTYYSDGYGFIVTPDGGIVLSSEHADKLADGENLFSFLEQTQFIDFSLAEVKTAMENGQSKSFAFTYKGARRLVSFTPTTVNDWYTFSLSSDAQMLAQEKVTNQIVLRLVAKLAVAGALLLVWITLRNRRHNREILLASQKYQSLLAHINGGMIVAVHAHTAEETIAVYVSPGFTTMTGYTLEDIQASYHGRYLDVLLEEDRSTAFDIYLRQLESGNTYRMPYRIRKKDGSYLWVMDNGYLVEEEDGFYNHSIITDITAVKAQEEELRMSENRFSIAINASSGALFEVDLKKQMYTHFENAKRMFGIDSDRLLADTRAFSTLPYLEFVDAITNYFFHPQDRAIAKNAMATLEKDKNVSYEARLRRYDNSYIWARVDLSLSVDEFGAPACLVGFMSNIDEIKKKAELLENKVQTDPMTGLYNKVAMAALANQTLGEYPNGRHALILLDIDNFKGINDTLGHAFGDVVLIEVCTKLKTMFRSNDIVGRMGGDEFSILMKNVPDTSTVLKKAAELSGAFRQTYQGEKENYKISCSMGIIVVEDGREPFEVLYRKADAALYQAKRQGKDQFALYQEQDAEDYPIETARTNDEELQNLKTSHDIAAHIFELLYTAKDFNVSIHMALAAIGQQYHVSRVSVFENDEDNLTTSNIYEWCNDGIPAEMDRLQNLKLMRDGESIFDCFDSNGLLYCNDVRELPPYTREILEAKGTLSTLKVTIINDEMTCGFIGFDECKEYRIWTAEEIEKLSFLAKVLSVFLFKRKVEVALLDNLHTRLKILDVLPDYICVVDPETHTVEYTNRKMRSIIPQARPGAFCFTALRGGQNAPCKTCLVERIKRGDTSNLEIISEDGRTHLKIDALSIQWTRNQNMVLLYGTEEMGGNQDALISQTDG